MNPGKLIILLPPILILAGCASNVCVIKEGVTQGSRAGVRAVDYRDTPQFHDLAERAREIGNENYPKILPLLADDPASLPQHFDIIFRQHLHLPQFGRQEPPGYVTGATIYLDADVFTSPTNSDWIGNDPTDFAKVLVHEMAHVAQDYGFKTVPEYWREGMADFVRYKLGFTNSYRCPECAEEFPDYTSGYTCAGAFLLYLDANYGTNLVRQLNSELRHGTYSDAFFAKMTGKSLNELWLQFQTTPPYTPVAARINKLRAALGYKDSKPPQNVAARLKALIDNQPEGACINEWLAGVATRPKRDRQSFNDLAFLTRIYLYFTQPGGTPFKYLAQLKNGGKLPGISKDDHGHIDEFLTFNDLNPAAYGNSRTFHCHTKGDSNTYSYTIARQTQNDAWKLQRAWKTDENNQLVEEYQVR